MHRLEGKSNWTIFDPEDRIFDKAPENRIESFSILIEILWKLFLEIHSYLIENRKSDRTIFDTQMHRNLIKIEKSNWITFNTHTHRYFIQNWKIELKRFRHTYSIKVEKPSSIFSTHNFLKLGKNRKILTYKCIEVWWKTRKLYSINFRHTNAQKFDLKI